MWKTTGIVYLFNKILFSSYLFLFIYLLIKNIYFNFKIFNINLFNDSIYFLNIFNKIIFLLLKYWIYYTILI